MFRPFFMALLFTVLCLPSHAQLGARAEVYKRSFFYVPAENTFYCTSYFPSSDKAQCSDDQSLGDSLLFYDVWGKAEDFGKLKVLANAYISRSIPKVATEFEERIQASARAWFIDSFTVYGPPAGTNGTLETAFLVTGSKFTNHLAGADGSLTAVNVDTGKFLGYEPIGAFGSSVTLSSSIVFGQPITVAYMLSTDLTLFNVANGGYDQQQAFMDLSNTATVTQFMVKDSSGKVVDAIVVAASGSTYGGALPVPEPPAVLLFAVGVAFRKLGIARRRI